MGKTIAYQGTRASFSEMAIERYFGTDAEPLGKVTFDAVFESLTAGEANFAALPIENSLIGPIFENIDLIVQNEIAVVGEVRLPIEHCLVGKKGQALEGIKRVYSHTKALAQCTCFFEKHPWMEPIVHFDTAGAARDIALSEEWNSAAIGSRKTAEVYPLEILKTHLEDEPSNTTRFLVLKKKENGIEKNDGTKASLLFTLQHVPGTLARVLKALANRDVNLVQIISRPIKEKPFEYLFFVDILFSGNIEEILSVLKRETQTLKLLGTYAPDQ